MQIDLAFVLLTLELLLSALIPLKLQLCLGLLVEVLQLYSKSLLGFQLSQHVALGLSELLELRLEVAAGFFPIAAGHLFLLMPGQFGLELGVLQAAFFYQNGQLDLLGFVFGDHLLAQRQALLQGQNQFFGVGGGCHSAVDSGLCVPMSCLQGDLQCASGPGPGRLQGEPPDMNFRVQLGLALNLVVFATVLNSVGIVVERSISEFGVGKSVGGTLEGCKDLTIAFTSIVLAAQVPRWGYRRTMLGGLAAVVLACLLLLALQSFPAVPVLFVVCGASFALVKTAVYASVGVIARDKAHHAALMNRLEGIYQVGAMVAPLVFAAMIGWGNWLYTYAFIAALGASALVLWAFTPLEECSGEESKKASMADLRELLGRPQVWAFLGCAWVYVMIEQSIGTWLPTFNRDVFGLSPALVANLLSFYFGSLALSRFAFGYLVRKFSAYWLQLAYLALAFGITLGVLSLTRGYHPVQEITRFSAIPPLVFIFCSVGFFIGPIYPTLNSMVLSQLPQRLHSSMTGLIIVASALGGTVGSQLLGSLSARFSTHSAFHFPLLPMAALAGLLVLFHRLEERDSASS